MLPKIDDHDRTLAMYGLQYDEKESLLGFVDLKTGKEDHDMEILVGAAITCSAVSPKTGQLVVVGSQHKMAYVYKRKSGQSCTLLNTITKFEHGIRAVAIDSDERYVCIGHEDNGFVLFSAWNSEILREIKTFGAWVRGLAFSVIPDPLHPSRTKTYLAAADWNGLIQVYALPARLGDGEKTYQDVKNETWPVVHTFNRNSGIYGLRFLNNKPIIVTSEADGHVIFNDIMSGKILWQSGACSSVATQVRTFSTFGQQMLVCGPPHDGMAGKPNFVGMLLDMTSPLTLPNEMPVTFGEWIADRPDLIHRQDPSNGNTILHRLADKGKVPDIAKYINVMKATGKMVAPIANRQGFTPLDIAINSHDHRKIKLFLEEYVKWKKYQGNDEIGKTLTYLADDYPDLLKLALKYSISVVDTVDTTIDRLVIDGEKKFKGARFTRPEQPVWTKDDEDEGDAPEEVVAIVCGFPNFLEENGIIERMAYQGNLLTCFETPALSLAIQYKWDSYGYELYFYQHKLFLILQVLPMTIGVMFYQYEYSLSITDIVETICGIVILLGSFRQLYLALLPFRIRFNTYYSSTRKK